MMERDVLDECFHSLATEARELYVDAEVATLDGPPTPLQFIRDWVNANRPVVIRNAIDHWPALHKWTPDYLRDVIGDSQVTVAVTPDGYADAVTDGYFMLPEERTMSFSKLLDILANEDSTEGGIFYAQKQNSCFLVEYSQLVGDASAHIPWATQALGKMPDAVNFWIGDKRAITSMHKDFYENLYCVISGEKTFTLLPPSDQPFVPYEEFPSAVYKQDSQSGKFEVIKLQDTVPWIPVDALHPNLELYPSYAHARPISIRVRAGEMFYLPSMWYHHVQQSHGCISVNFWYDMEYDIKYNYFKFVETLKRKATSATREHAS